MPELPGRPDADQLRRQARELLRAAADHEPSAVARLSAVSQRVTLSAAQLAVAREYGFASWPALRAEAERRRRLAEPSDAFGDRWSFGGATPVETSVGVLHPGGLLAGPDHATMDISLISPDVTWEQFVADKREALFSGDGQEELEQACSAAMARAAELRQSGELPAASETSRQLAQLCASLTGQRPLSGVPRGWSTMIGARGRADGPAYHLDIAADLPRIGIATVRVDSLISEPGAWHLYLRVKPRRRIGSEDPVMPVRAEDDLGGRYLTELGGGAGNHDYEELALQFRPRLDPLARALTLTFTAGGEQVTLDIRL